MIELAVHRDGVLLPVRAQAGARRNAVRAIQDGALKVAVTQVAEKGKANQAIVAQLSKSLGLPKAQIQLHSGATSSSKRFLVQGIEIDELRRRIQQVT